MTSFSPLFICDIAAIDVSNRLRPVDPARVEALAASINEIGLQQPIRVRRAADSEDANSNGVVLVAGAHRVAAHVLLGFTEIAAIWSEADDREARLVEIDENLIRNELSELDRAVSLSERKRLYEEIHPEAAHGGDRKSKKPKTVQDQVANIATWSRFSKDAAAKTGFSERTIQAAVKLMADLGPDLLPLIRQSGIADNGAQLRALADVETPEQRLLVAQQLAAGAANVERAKFQAGVGTRDLGDPDAVALKAFLSVWTRASTKAKASIRRVIADYDAPAKVTKVKGGKAAGGQS